MKKQLINIILISVIFLFFQVNTVLAHGGEDHSHEEETPAAAVNTAQATVSKLFTSKNLEVLIKYPESHTSEKINFQVFLTDFQTNKPVSGGVVSIYFESRDSTITPVKLQAVESDIPGLYQAAITFEKAGNYRVLTGISKGSINESFSIESLSVENSSVLEETGTTNRLLPLLLVLITILMIPAIYLFTRKTKKLSVKEAQ